MATSPQVANVIAEYLTRLNAVFLVFDHRFLGRSHEFGFGQERP
jgi:hypothetical protein